MFDIVIDYPDSIPALHDLKVGLYWTFSTLMSRRLMSRRNACSVLTNVASLCNRCAKCECNNHDRSIILRC